MCLPAFSGNMVIEPLDDIIINMLFLFFVQDFMSHTGINLQSDVMNSRFA